MTADADLGDTIEPRSDQLNAEDLLTGPRTVTITAVRKVNGEQPIEIVTAEFGPGRPWKPSKTSRRMLVLAWGRQGAAYVGRRVTLYRDPDVKFGGEAVGGIRVSHMSHIGRPLTMTLTETRGKRKPHRVEPLPDLTPVEQLRAKWQTADPARRKVIEREVAALQQQQPAPAAQQDPAGQQPAPAHDDEVDVDVEHDPTLDPEFGREDTGA